MIRTAAISILTVFAAAVPSAAQTPATDTAPGVHAQAAAARKVAQVYRRGERREDQRAEQTETVSRTVKLGPQGEIDLENMSGGVTVTRGGGNEATITAVKRARAATDEEAREMLGLVKIEITERPERVEIRSLYPHFEGRRPPGAARRNANVSVAYTITAPAGTRLRVRTMSGNLAVSDITGELAIEAMSGNITIERAARVMIAKTMSGDVALTDVKSDGSVDAGTMSGDVTMRQVKARRIKATAISGNVLLVDVDCDRIEGQSTSGGVTYEGALVKNGRYSLGTHSGTVKILLAGDTGFEVDANSWGGNIQTDLALTVRDAGIPQPPGGRGRIRTLKGTYGDGSAVLDLTTFSGTIVIGKRTGR